LNNIYNNLLKEINETIRTKIYDNTYKEQLDKTLAETVNELRKSFNFDLEKSIINHLVQGLSEGAIKTQDDLNSFMTIMVDYGYPPRTTVWIFKL